MNTKWIVRAAAIAIMAAASPPIVAQQTASPAPCDSVDERNCDLGCDVGDCRPCFFVFGEFLELRPRDSRVAYAVAADSNLPPPGAVQVGPYAVVEQGWQAAFRVGAGWFIDDCSSLSVSFTRFESSATDAVSATAPFVLRSLVRHPQGPSANLAGDFLSASAQQDLDFDLIDLDYRAVWHRSDCYALTWLAGIRYAKLNQEFRSLFQNNGFETVATDIRFDGIGPRLGLEGERFLRCGLSLYGKSAANFVVGNFTADYQQGGNAAPLPVNTSWRGAKIVTILDLELGLAWTGANERVRISGGYLLSGWFNTVKTDEWIQAVQRNDTLGLGDTMTFDGFVARAELRF